MNQIETLVAHSLVLSKGEHSAQDTMLKESNQQSVKLIPSTTRINPEWRAKALGFDETDSGVRAFAITCEGFIRHVINNDRSKGCWMAVYAPQGVGKTKAGKRMVRTFNSYAVDLWKNQVWRVGRVPSAKFCDWSKVSVGDEDDWKDFLYEIRDVDFLVLDDVGSEVDRFKTGEPVDRLRQVLNQWEHRWLYLNTNSPKEQWANQWDNRIVSRLNQATYISLLGVPDWRETHLAR